MSCARVVITGMGAVTPIGVGVPAFVDALLAGRSGAGPITLFDPASLPTRIAAQVDLATEQLESPDRKIGFALRAAAEAMGDATSCNSRPDGLASVCLGMGLELFSMEDMVAVRHRGAGLPEGRRARLGFLQTPSDLCVHLLSQRHGLRAPPNTLVSACAAGADAIGAAFHLVAHGRRRWMLAGGSDSMINPLGVGGFCTIRATSTSNDSPTTASRPFDRRRNGFLLGEGAGVLVLERLDDALARGASIHAEVLGYGCSFDAHGISEPHPEGRGALQAMQRALADAGLSPDAVDAVSAHGTSTPKNDVMETIALRRLLGERAGRVPVSAPKSMIGHAISAAGAVESIGAIGCMKRGRVHPTINLDEPDPQCDLDYVTGGSRAHAQRVILCNSFAFGGQNAALVFARWDGS